LVFCVQKERGKGFCGNRKTTLLLIIFVLEQTGVGLADSGTGDARNRIAGDFLTEEALVLFGKAKRYTHLWGEEGTFVIQANA